ncbi:hypothetical protein PN498_18335 [Oscillatoria sp. CS-180]|uniref:hypothetical protein n=1 Tax=Oscillatoria sp. CS-180 TaxID=3021720 RepID=UPI00232FC6DD|nr:hypothetical protein [Oscillatoria sp. CS-180]MDB9527958.1 hypothetical protein [Oscillatoria sp. CS-180]
MKSYWLSWGLLILAYATYGQLLHAGEPRQYVWWATLAFIIVKAGILTLVWQPVRDFALRGFKTDVGYTVMVLLLASLAVLAVVQFRAFAYVIVLMAAALLARVDCLILGLGDRLSFLTLVLLSIIGLGLSWLPILLFQGAELMTQVL